MLGETLGLETVAEGVEIDDQVTAPAARLRGRQGFLFARSSSLQAVAAMSFAARRAERRALQSLRDRLTATGRFHVGNVRPRSVA
jgi:sensor c-di-GMP phosphodiesterase-like protein